MKQLNSYQLCYVEGGRWMDEDITLYFTERDVKDQWGDGWSKHPYEHNAGTPYEEDTSVELGVENGRGVYPKIDIFKVILTTNEYSYLITPCSNTDNSIYSVKDINSKSIPWVTIKKDDTVVSLYAGTTYKKFLSLVKDLDFIEILVPYHRFIKKK